MLSDFPIRAVEQEPYAYCAGWDCLANKGVMMVHLDVPDMPGGVDLATTHLNSDDTAKVPSSRSLQAHHLQLDEMNTFIARHRSAEAPLIVGGDFNVEDSPERYYYRRPAGRSRWSANTASNRTRPVTRNCRWTCPSPGCAARTLQAFAAGGSVAVRRATSG